MDILYTCDDNYVWLMGISVISLFKNNTEIDKLRVFLIGDKISLNSKNLLKQIANQYKRVIEIIDLPDLKIPDVLLSTRWPTAAFARLYAGLLLPKSVHKILYLDCDTIVNGSIEELSAIDLDKYMCGGIKDCIGRNYRKNIGLNSEDIYINAGVILFNVNEMRKINVANIIECYLNKYLKFINYADQDILNGIFKGKIKVLPSKFNVMTILGVYSYEEIMKLRKPVNYYNQKELIDAVNNPVVIHFTTNMKIVRPWFSNASHPYTTLFKAYMEISPWKNIILQEMIFTSRESKFISVINKLPRKISINLLGLIHAELKPRFNRIRSK